MKNEFGKCTSDSLLLRLINLRKFKIEEFPLIELPLLHIYR